MTVRLSRSLHERLTALAGADHDVEICGLLLGGADHIERIVPAANVAPDPARRFEIDPAILLAAHRAMRNGGPSVIGHYHSHPNGKAEPSACDADMALPDGQFWLIVAAGVMRLWQAGSSGLHGRFVEQQLVVD